MKLSTKNLDILDDIARSGRLSIGLLHKVDNLVDNVFSQMFVCVDDLNASGLYLCENAVHHLWIVSINHLQSF